MTSVFQVPSTILIGGGARREIGAQLQRFGVQRVLLVTDVGMMQLGPAREIATLIEEAGGSLFDSHNTTASSSGNLVTVQTSGEVVSLLPFFGTITVQASATANVESFDPQGQP